MLEQINGASDLRALPAEKLPELAEEIRAEIIRVVAANGGHLASNLGVVELTIALLRVFDPGEGDKLLFDVSHQAYAYKLLTGRSRDFATLRQTDGISGFQKRGESTADAFGAGHAGTSISAGLGFAAARDLGQDGTSCPKSVVAIVGDASIANGVSLEALNNVASTTGRMIVVLNDNQMSIGKNVGGLSRAFGKLLASPRYNRVKTRVEIFGINRLKLSWARNAYHRVESALKSLFTHGRNKPFEAMGLRYMGPFYGHDIAGLENAFESAKRSHMPVLLHVGTQKGRGYKPAEESPEKWHSTGKFELGNWEIGKLGNNEKDTANDKKFLNSQIPNFLISKGWSDVFGEALCEFAREDKRIVATTAGMCDGTGLGAFHAEFPSRFYDVGICEEHQMTFAAGLAAAGLRPVVAVYSTFAQRAVDAVIHDIALQKLPVLICLDRAGAVPGDGATHHGIYDIALLRCVPGLAIMQPRDANDLRVMMRMALDMDGPVVIRYPRGECQMENGECKMENEWSARIFTNNVQNPSVAIWTLGPEDKFAAALSGLLAEKGIGSVHVDARFAKPVDGALLASQFASGIKTFVTVEDGTVCGGFGSAVEEYFATHNLPARVIKAGWPDEFIPHASNRNDLAQRYGFTPETIAAKFSM